MTTPSVDREVEKKLRDHDVRYTAGRRAVVSALAASDGPRSASEMHEALGTQVPLSSLYRSLAVLEEAGVVVPHYGAKGLTRYELAEWLAGHHHHVICIECGAVEDIAIPEPYETEVRKIVEDISSLVSFVAVDHALEIEGRCSRCR
jgi:Fur family ferric uptake transcriptional regulator